MKGPSKAALVALGYAAALALATGAVAAHVAMTDPNDASGGMQAFGDALLFVAVFGTVSLVPTGAALYWLRQHQGFWNAVSLLGLLLALTGVAAAVLFTLGRQADTHTTLGAWAAFSVLRLLISPLSAMALGLAAVLARFATPRRLLLGAAVVEVLVSAYMGAMWFLPLLLQR